MDNFSSSKPNIEAVYTKYADMLYRVAVAELQSDMDAQDAVQDVFIKYISAVPSFKDDEHEKAWFLRVTVNRCHDMLRSRKVRLKIHSDIEIEPVDSVSKGRMELFEILSCIPEKYKSTVVLHCLEGLGLQETADVLGISLSAAKMRLKRAREIIRKEE
ncbi:MAG: RNA polymerase sigma factor [Ruminococcus sp.]|nr:RNA polymerase sigma factor [Ruminococcus sp.]MDO4420332.1 RNA polymerase sigma factor [Ruminococcus sp.]